MKKSTMLIAAILIVVLTACSGTQSQTSVGTSQTSVSATTSQNAASAPTTQNSASSAAGDQANSGTTPAASATPVVMTASSVTMALAAKQTPHDTSADLEWDSATEIAITLNGTSISAASAAVTIKGTTATITAAGTYRLSGSLDDGQIIVNTADEALVRLILNGVAIQSSTSAPLAIMKAEQAVIILADGTENTLSDATTYVYATPDTDEPNAALFSAADLSINGTGALTVRGNANDGITSKDGLIIGDGTLTVEAVDDGIRGKDYVVLQAGSVTIKAQGDGIKADNAEAATKGYIAIANGTLNVTAMGDALSAETDVLIMDGTLGLAAGGGSSASVAAEASAKGIKAAQNVVIDGGTLTITAAEDALHSDANLVINGGTIELAAGDDGAHADATLTINAGDLRVTESYEGLESAAITINDGTIHVVAQDDGVNVGGGGDSSGMRPGGRPGQAGTDDALAYQGAFRLSINGGYLVVDSTGDGLDSNGAIIMTAGLVIVNGPTEQMNGALDYDGGFNITGGLLVAAGSGGMAEAPGSASSQPSVLINYDTVQAANSLVQIQNNTGEVVLTFAPSKQYQSLVFSSPDLLQGNTYTITNGGKPAGVATDGLYETNVSAAGTAYANFSVAEIVTEVGQRRGRMR